MSSIKFMKSCGFKTKNYSGNLGKNDENRYDPTIVLELRRPVHVHVTI